MNRVVVCDRTRSAHLSNRLKRNLSRALKMLRLDQTEVSLSLVSDRVIQQLNRTYRKIDRPTDVLSFAQPAPPVGGRLRVLGDIVISKETAQRQATNFKRTLGKECDLLAVHGLLHLLGHDHARPREAKRMFGLQDRILRRIGSHA